MADIKCECGEILNFEYTQCKAYSVPLGNPNATPRYIEDSESITDVCFVCPNCGEITLNKKQLKKAIKMIETDLPHVWYYTKHILTDYQTKD